MKSLFILIPALLVISCVSLAENPQYANPDLIPGDSKKVHSGEFSDSRVATAMLQAGAYGMSGFTNLGEGNIHYLLMGNVLGSFDFSTRQYLGGLPLTRWPHQHREPEVLERLVSRNYPDELRSSNILSVGCLGATPLRYGDINQDGNSELALLLTNNLSIFSTQKNKIIFSSELSVEDWLNAEETATYYANFGPQPSDNDPQYQSRLIAETSTGGGWRPGYRGYAKLYFGDFNEDGAHDILVWRKLYASRLRGDSVRGFQHLRDTLLHYKFVEGEYQPQATEEAIIRSWLTAKQITWQQGYPSKSECPGEEGKLIPEMHDPLLNDPDVLK